MDFAHPPRDSDRPNTFNNIKKALDGISSNLLSERLKELEEQGLVVSELYSAHPPRYQYTLTEKGEALEPVFNSLLIWGSSHLDPCYKQLIDPATDEELEIGYYSKKTGKRAEAIQVKTIEYELQPNGD